MALRLRANTRNDLVSLEQLPDETDTKAAEAVLGAAFERAMRRRFGPTPEQEEIANFIAGLFERYRKLRNIKPIEMEAVIRSVLEPGISLEGIDYRTLTVTRMLTTSEALEQLQLSDRELDELLYDAEQQAIAQGYRPNLAY